MSNVKNSNSESLHNQHVLFVANRGEICRRIIKTANSLGIKTIVPLLADNKNTKKTLPYFAREATEVIYYKSNNPLETYLSIEDTVALAKQSNATLLHPGYGFLSENADFVKALTKEGILFVGPTAETMERLGSKTNAKWLAKEQDVPIIPGLELNDLNKINIVELKEDLISKVGLPLIIKAAAGGGGRGMRVVKKIEDLENLLASASEESYRAFGSRQLFIEKYIEYGRHIEVQIIGDSKGNIIHLYERDCSIQRKFQKVIEIAPAQNFKEDIKLKLYESAIKLAKAGNLTNAGTFEFLVDTSTDQFFFIESNPRLQVEHTITEEITGLDIVELQLKVALGASLPEQSTIQCHGVSIQARVCHEIPEKNFLPSTGKLEYYKRGDLPPSEGRIRVDLGYEEGEIISGNFDSLLQKSISYGNNFIIAKSNLLEHLNNLVVYNIGTNISFLISILKELEWKIPTTTWLESNLLTENIHDNKKVALISALNQFINTELKKERESFLPSPKLSCESPNFESLHFENVKIDKTNDNDHIKVVDVLGREDILCIYAGYPVIIKRPDIKFKEENESISLDKKITSPLPGTILKILVSVGDIVPKGKTLVKLDSMKTEHSINAKFDCIVDKICLEEGSKVNKGSVILEVE